MHEAARGSGAPGQPGRSGVSLLASLLIAPLFLVSAATKITAPTKALSLMAAVGLPLPVLGLWLAAALEIVLPILLVVGWQVRLSAWTLAAYCIATALIFHSDLGAPGQLMSFLKNVAIAGGLIHLGALEQPAGRRRT